MKKLTAKLRTKSFWVTFIGALTVLFSRFGWENASGLAESIAEGIGAVLLLCGMIAAPSATEKKEGSEEDSTKEEDR